MSLVGSLAAGGWCDYVLILKFRLFAPASFARFTELLENALAEFGEDAPHIFYIAGSDSCTKVVFVLCE